MKFVTAVTALALAAAAIGAQAQVVDMNTRLASAGNLLATPSTIAFSVRGGLSNFKTISVSDNGAGYASNLNVTLTRTSGSLGDLEVTGDTCNGATLAPNGTCTIHLEFDGTCPKAETSKWNIVITSTNAPTVTIPVTGASVAGICQ